MRLKALVHGDAGTGKSWLGASCPGPRLVLDAEGGSHFARQSQPDGTTVRPPAVEWNPMKDEPPSDLDPNASVFVRIRSMPELEQAFKWLESGQHPFRSVILDSLTDIQLTCRYKITSGQTQEKDVTDMRSWGKLLDQIIELCRQFRNLTDHPTNPLDAVLFIAGSEFVDGHWQPQLQGGISRRIAGYFDLVMFMQNEMDLKSGNMMRRARIVKGPGWVAKDRTHVLTEKYGEFIDNPTINEVMDVLNEA